MSDCTTSEIWIGGTIERELVSGLVEVLSRDGASCEFGDASIPSDASEEVLLEYMDNESLLNFKCDQAPNGYFGSTEFFCREHGIPFDRLHDGFAEYDGERARFRPGSPVFEQVVDANGKEIVNGETVRQALAKLNSYSNASTWVDGDRNENLYEAGMRILRDVCPTLPPPLENFNVVA